MNPLTEYNQKPVEAIILQKSASALKTAGRDLKPIALLILKVSAIALAAIAVSAAILAAAVFIHPLIALLIVPAVIVPIWSSAVIIDNFIENNPTAKEKLKAEQRKQKLEKRQEAEEYQDKLDYFKTFAAHLTESIKKWEEMPNTPPSKDAILNHLVFVQLFVDLNLILKMQFERESCRKRLLQSEENRAIHCNLSRLLPSFKQFQQSMSTENVDLQKAELEYIAAIERYLKEFNPN